LCISNKSPFSLLGRLETTLLTFAAVSHAAVSDAAVSRAAASRAAAAPLLLGAGRAAID